MLCLITFLSLLSLSLADSISLDWVLTKETVTVAPGQTRIMILINGTWPPPTTIVNLGDTIEINIENQFDESTTLHAHGFHQTNNNLYDGPEGITQCGVAPGKSYTYKWTAETAGTFWVHSHHPRQYPAGLRAPFIVKNVTEAVSNAYNYDVNKDIVVDVSDTYYSQPQTDVDSDYLSSDCGPGFEVPPSGVAMKDQTSPIIQTASVNNGRVRLRFINMSAFSTMIIFLSGGTQMRIMEVDSVLMNRDYMPLATAIELNAGQRTSVIVDLADAQYKNFNIYTTVGSQHYAGNPCATNSRYAFTAVGTVQFSDATAAWPPLTFTTGSGHPDSSKIWLNSAGKLDNLPSWANKTASPNAVMSDDWYFSNLPPAEQQPLITYQPASSGNPGTLFLELNLTADPTAGWAQFNNVKFTTGGPPVLLEAMRPKPTCSSPAQTPVPTMTNALGQEKFYGNAQNPVQNAVSLQLGQQVIMMISSYVGAHIFHMHSHDFQVLYHQTADDAFVIPDVRRIKANSYSQPAFPLRRDTFFIESHTVAIIAWTANNPGAWFFHCHNDFHALSGMAGVFVTGDLTTASTAGIWGEWVYEQCGDSAGGYPATFAQWPRSCFS